MNAQRVRITSDGTPQGTRVELEDGTLIKGVQKVAWTNEVRGFARVQLELLATAVDVVGLVDLDDVSMPTDPESVPLLQEPQDVPEGPGFFLPPLPATDGARESRERLGLCVECGFIDDHHPGCPVVTKP